MDYAITEPFPDDHNAVVIPLSDITISPPVVSIARDAVVAFPFTRGEMDASVMLYND
jgi:hypothetical protein